MIAVVLLATSAGGCSFVFSEGPPDDHLARSTFLCGESHAPPVLDTIGAGLFALTAGSLQAGKERSVTDAAAMGKDPAQTRHDINVSTGVLVAFAAVDVASAVYGYRAVGECRQAQETRLADAARARWLPPPYGVPPYGEPPPLWPPRLAAPPPAPAAPPATPENAAPAGQPAPETPPAPATPSP
ncbi:MAG TPA: hypothetical protein VHL80_10255 [Polyangia bacterium]|nr:hypothetical protein [Polyangia bacterium]